MASRTKLNKNAEPASVPPNRSAERVALSELHFDNVNPRFGPGVQLKNEEAILNRIANVHGVGDLLSSLAVNGYSDAEPLIGLRDGKTITIKEGNRRLAACLILAEDPRARSQQKRGERYKAIWKRHDCPPVDPVPVIVYEANEADQILPYLGVKHIVGAEAWSAWAKAAWADELIREHGIPIESAMEMIGDEQDHLPRILGSYYMVQQLINEERFDPGNSIKNGAGGAEFPFSLVYNALDFTGIREWIGFERKKPKANPIPAENLDNAEDLMDFLCGNRQKDFEPIIKDSRQLKYLNRIAGERQSIVAVKSGELTVEKAAQRLEPAPTQIAEGFVFVIQRLEELTTIVSRSELAPKESDALLDPAKTAALLAGRLHEQIYKQYQQPSLRLINDQPKAAGSRPKKKIKE